MPTKPELIEALRRGSRNAEPHRRGALEAIIGYNDGDLLDDPAVHACIEIDGDTARISWHALRIADDGLLCGETGRATIALALALALGDPNGFNYGVRQWNDQNSRSAVAALAIACGLSDPYQDFRRVREFADALIATGDTVGVSVGAVLTNVLEHGTAITTADQAREAIGATVIERRRAEPLDADAVDALRIRPDLRSRLAGAVMPWQDGAATPLDLVAIPGLDDGQVAEVNARVAGGETLEAATVAVNPDVVYVADPAPAAPVQRPDTQSGAVLDAAVLDVIRRAGGILGLPGIAASLRQDPYPAEGGPVSVAAVLSAIDRLTLRRELTIDTADTTTLYRIAK